MRFEKARVSWLVGLLLYTGPISAARSANHSSPQGSLPSGQSAVGFGAGPGAGAINLPSFDSERVQKVTKELLRTFKTAKPNNWIELQQAAGSVMVNATVPGKLPKFNQQRVGAAVEQLAAEIQSQNPGSWQELGKILNRFTGVIPSSVMENIIAFRILQRQASDKNSDKLAQNDALKPETESENDAGRAAKDRLNPQAREAIDKQLDDNIGKFSGFMPPPTPYSPFNGLTSPPAPGAAKNEKGENGKAPELPKNINVFSSNPANNASGNQPMVPVLSQKPMDFPDFDLGSPAQPPAAPGADEVAGAGTTINNSNTIVQPKETPALNADKVLNALVSQLPPKNEVQSASALPASASLPGAVKAEAPQTEKEKKRQLGTKVGKTGASGGANYGVAGVGAGGEVLPGAQSWLASAEDWVRSALGLKDPDPLWNGDGEALVGSEETSEKADGVSFLALGGLMDGGPSKSRVVASVAEATGVDVSTAHRLYQGALYSAWGSTLGFLAYAFRRLRRRRK